jgi:hypothetical protein
LPYADIDQTVNALKNCIYFVNKEPDYKWEDLNCTFLSTNTDESYFKMDSIWTGIFSVNGININYN